VLLGHLSGHSKIEKMTRGPAERLVLLRGFPMENCPILYCTTQTIMDVRLFHRSSFMLLPVSPKIKCVGLTSKSKQSARKRSKTLTRAPQTAAYWLKSALYSCMGATGDECGIRVYEPSAKCQVQN